MNYLKIGLKSAALCAVAILAGASLAYSAQCLGITKKGAQCKRQAPAGADYCWQHTGQETQDVKKPKSKESAGYSQRAGNDDTRCKAKTKKGTQCKRKAEPGATYCWQHAGKPADITLNIKNNKDPQKSKTIKVKKSLKADKQCEAITKAGTRCKRSAKAGANYCWQHGG